MSQCRHCGRDNEDGVTKCVECGLEMAPSPTWRLLSSAIVGIKARRPRRIIVGIVILFGVLVVYLLALGPILRLYGVRPFSGWDRLPAIVRMVYEPLDKMPIPEPVGKWLRGYNRWWMRASSEKTDFVRQIAQIDSWIKPGKLQSDVIGALGEPLWWTTNADRVVAQFSFGPPAVPFDILTNGFRIEFSNGVVVAKTATTVLSDGKRGDGAANEGEPIRSETNRASPAAGSGR